MLFRSVKLDKAGGLREAVRMVHAARACGLKVMLGCMISSSASTTAAGLPERMASRTVANARVARTHPTCVGR